MHIRLYFFLVLSLWANVTFAQRDFIQFDIGSTVYLNNSIRYNIPDQIHFKTKASETILVGINYQRKLSELFSVSSGFYFTGTSFSYSFKYNWQVNLNEKKWNRTRFNDGVTVGVPTFKIPLIAGIEFPLSDKNKKHKLSLHAGLSFAYLLRTWSISENIYYTETPTDIWYNPQVPIVTIRDNSKQFQLFAHIRAAYYFKIPKLGQWNFFCVFEPQITKNVIDTYIILMPGKPDEKILRPDMINHNIQLGLGYRLGFIK